MIQGISITCVVFVLVVGLVFLCLLASAILLSLVDDVLFDSVFTNKIRRWADKKFGDG